MHVPVCRWNAALAHDDGDLMQRFRQRGPKIPVTFLRIELEGKAADIALGIRRAAFAGNGGEAREHIFVIHGMSPFQGENRLECYYTFVIVDTVGIECGTELRIR